MISDNPVPYMVKISTALDLSVESLFRPPVENAKITLIDAKGNMENFNEVKPGEYITNSIIRGEIGHTYHIRIETYDGKLFEFESEPEMMHEGGEITDIRYEFESNKKEETYGEVQADVFNVFLDATTVKSEKSYVRWRFTGIYEVLTNPELHEIFSQGSSYKDPLPCSGYIVTPALGGGKLEKTGECTCCTCWVNQFEQLPQLSDVQLVSKGEF